METGPEYDLMTSPEAAEFLGVSDARIRQLCAEGVFPGAVKRGRWWFVPRASLEAFKENPPFRRRRSRREWDEVPGRRVFTTPQIQAGVR